MVEKMVVHLVAPMAGTMADQMVIQWADQSVEKMVVEKAER